ncbi:MAG: CocE/NonD family hydrolase [Pseudoxanthomonas sp.]
MKYLLPAAVSCGLSWAMAGAVSAAAAGSWPSSEGSGPCAVSKQENVPARMRDGVILRSDVYRPDTKDKVPVILMRTQYGKEAAQVQPSRFQTPAWYASHCYIVVIQDVRGQYASDGEFYEYANERQDGYDSVEWAARLPGSNGKVGMYGSSYVGATQWLAATGTPPSLKAIVPSNTGSDYYDGWTYENGAFRLGFIQPWMMGLALTAAQNRGDEETAAHIAVEEKQIAQWMRRHPYAALPVLKPGDPKVAPWYFDTLKHSTKDDYWKAFQIEGHYDRVKVPVLAFEGWYDSFLDGAIKNFNGMRVQGGNPSARNGQRMVIGPWEHLGWGRPESPASPRLKAIGPIANSPVNELTIAFFDHYLKGIDNGFAETPRIDYFRMGDNTWHHTSEWPLAQTEYRRLYLASGGHAASLMGDGVLLDVVPGEGNTGGGSGHAAGEAGNARTAAAMGAASDGFVYDPSNPVPSLGGHSCCTWTSTAIGQFDQAPIEQRPDILVYSSAPLEQPLDVTGPVSVRLFAKSTAVDTDFTAKLIDVFPDGTAVNVSNGIQRASFRQSLERPTPIVPSQVYEYTIALWPTSNLFAVGHRIRIEISSSDYPQFAPNPNTGRSFSDSQAWQTATQTILHDADHPSAVILPVVRVESVDPAPLPQ